MEHRQPAHLSHNSTLGPFFPAHPGFPTPCVPHHQRRKGEWMKLRRALGCALLLTAALALTQFAYAIPSYSRQTGLPCATCHYAPPELTPFGRKFKLEGYTFSTKAQVTDEAKDHNAVLNLLESFPLSVVFDTSF